MNPGSDSEPIGAAEDLGRGIYSRGLARQAGRSHIRLNAFLERPGVRTLSVDRLSIAPVGDAVALAAEVGRERGRSFHGWAVVKARAANRNGRSVVASPQPERNNPYHADIVLPADAVEDRLRQKEHAQQLADQAVWRARPNGDVA